MKPKVLIVGSGLFGLTCAERITSILNQEVVVWESREHIGGNAWSEFDPASGIEFHKYGSHIFHTNNEQIWNYVTDFTSFNNYVHTVWTKHKTNFYQMPINLSTISSFYNLALNPQEAKDLINSQRILNFQNPNNFEDIAKSTIGEPLYSAFVKNYTLKQWQINPKELPPETFSRLPIRYNFDSRYFSDKYQGLPKDGYQQFILNLSVNSKIKIELSKNFFNYKTEASKFDLIIYTGPIDKYFGYKHGELGWRTLDLEFQNLKVEDFQGTSVVNYADNDVKFTRIHEFKHLHPERSYTKEQTLIAREYPRKATTDDEPYYPINSSEDKEKIKKYRLDAELERKTIFGGRLGSYKYLDMHMAIASALHVFSDEIKPRIQ